MLRHTYLILLLWMVQFKRMKDKQKYQFVTIIKSTFKRSIKKHIYTQGHIGTS